VEDLALVADVLSFHDARDPASLAMSRGSILAQATEAWKLKPMFALVRTSAWNEHADPVLKEAFGELVESLGDRVEEISIDATTEQGLAAHRLVQNAELAVRYGPILDRAPAQVSARLTAQIEEGRAIKAADYLKAKAFREQAYRTLQELFLNYGTILTPAAPGPAPKGLGSTGNPVFNAFWTFVGTPSVTLPLLEADDLPIGVQLVGARRDDGRLLRTARLLERQLAEQ
jgi:Asp-tRNA(Asn)/Glu-tRNA(Gln) amidotransferase A subunit family amidase